MILKEVLQQEKMEKESTVFFAYSWHLDPTQTQATVIRIYGLTEKNKNICILVEDFLPYCYLQLPDTITWSKAKTNQLIQKLNDLLKEKRPVNYKFEMKKRLYYANINEQGEKKLFPYLLCYCSCVEDIKQLSYKVRRPIRLGTTGELNLKMHEDNATPILQLTSQRLLPTAGWIKGYGKRIPKEYQETSCDYEYRISWKQLFPYEKNSVGRPLLMGFDLEVNSSVPSSMPKAGRPEDKVFQISCVFALQGSKEVEKILLTLGEPNSLEGCEIRCYETEADLLMGFTDILQEKQPNVCIGYNIFDFDIPYLINRAKLTNVISDFDKQSFLKDSHCREKTIKWSSSAYKNQSFQFLDVEGRIFVDLLPLVKRDHRLANYQLKTVAANFLQGITKDPLDAKGIFKCYRLGMQGGEKGKKALALVGKYCIQDSYLVVRLFEVLTTWIALCEMSKVTGVPIFSLYTQGQQIKIFSQVYRKSTHENIVVEKNAYLVKDSDYYVGATVFPPVPGVYDNVVPEDFSAMYPSLIIAYNMCFSTLVTDDSVPDSMCHVHCWNDHISCEHDPAVIRKKQVIEELKKGEEKMSKLRKERDLRENKSNKEYYNKKILKIKNSLKPLREERSQLNKSKAKHIICEKRKYRWLKQPIGLLPEILSNLLSTRSATKKELAKVEEKLKAMKEDDEKYYEMSVLRDVLDQRQNALKVSANSGYGITGARKGYLTCMPIAMCTTYMGRKSIQLASETIEKKFKGTLIYGDTDSNYISFPHLKSTQEIWDYADLVSKEVTKLFPPPMSLAFEKKIYARFLIITKKRYMSLACDRDGKFKIDKDTGKPIISKKGVLLQRRDNCKFVRKVYEDVIMSIFDKKPVEEIMYNIVVEINKLCSGCFPSSDFIISKSIGEMEFTPSEHEENSDKGTKTIYKLGDYKLRDKDILPSDEDEKRKILESNGFTTEKEYYLSKLPGQAQLGEKMRERGQLVSAGSRIEYIITTNGGHTAKQYEKIEDAEYFKRHSSSLKIDYLYYLKQLSTPLDQVLDIIYGKEPKYKKGFVTSQYKYRYKIREKVIQTISEITAPKIFIIED